jgi:chromosome segregation ATPase
MSLNPLKLFEKLISEHGSAAALRDHLALVKEKNTNLEAEKELLKAKLEQSQAEKAALETKASELQILLENAKKEITNLESVRVALKEQTQLENRIRQLEAVNRSLEQMLRV